MYSVVDESKDEILADGFKSEHEANVWIEKLENGFLADEELTVWNSREYDSYIFGL